jgi:imidazolonepropionase-like amidohydrolase
LRVSAAATLFALAACAPVEGDVARGTAGSPTPPPRLAIVGVHVVPMDRERVLADHTVVVDRGRIVAFGPASQVTVPVGSLVVDGSGRYLMPGLVDMHIHAVAGAGVDGDGAWQQMALLVANGVTTARSLAGAATAMELRRAIEAGDLLGPRLYLAGPSLNRNSVPTPESVRLAVARQAADGFDFLKTHGVTSDVYDAMVESAREAGLPLVGHVTSEYGLHRALAAGQQIEHLDGYLAATIPDGAPVDAPQGQVFFGPELDHMSEAAMPALARRTLEAGVWNSPTLALFEVVAEPDSAESYLARAEMRFVPQTAKQAWAAQVAEMRSAPILAERRARYLELRRALTRALRDAGAPLLAGSDSPQLFMAPGFALHRELRALQRAGLTPFEALSAATSNPARYIGAAPFGVIERGAAADLLLLDANPLLDVANAARIHGVVLRGQWLSRERIEALKEDVAAAAAPGGSS